MLLFWAALELCPGGVHWLEAPTGASTTQSRATARKPEGRAQGATNLSTTHPAASAEAAIPYLLLVTRPHDTDQLRQKGRVMLSLHFHSSEVFFAPRNVLDATSRGSLLVHVSKPLALQQRLGNTSAACPPVGRHDRFDCLAKTLAD
jgi:hypothetical protein